MTRSIFYGLCGLSVSLLASLPSPALAIQHGCTNPPDLKSIKIGLDLGGDRSTASGPLCSAIQQAAAMVDRSSMSREQKAAAKQELNKIQAQATTAASGPSGSATINVGLTCGGGQGCKFTLSGGATVNTGN